MLLKPQFSAICYGLFGLLFFLSGALLLFSQSYLRNTIVELTRLVNGTEGYDNWMHPKAPLMMQFYIFNITNMADFQNGDKPSVVEVGPYVYTESKDKELVYRRGGMLGYKDAKVYHFDTYNGYNEEDVIYSLNLPMMTISRLLDDKLPSIVVKALSYLLSNEPLMIKLTVKELLWGYNASIFELINKELHRFHLPTINFPQFGLFSQGGGNGSYGGLFEMRSGEGDGGVDGVGQIVKWKHNKKLSFWSGDYCNQIKGTDGSIFSPFTTPSHNLSIFSTDICRSINLIYNSTTKVYHIPTHIFTIPPETFQSYHFTPENECFCVPNKLKCLKSGVLDISACKMGAPIVVSLPHFLYADSSYLHGVTGLHPSSNLHQTNLFVEPLTGIVLKAEKRLQINFFVENYPLFKASHHLNNSMIYPVVWLQEAGSIDEKNAALFYNQLTSKVNFLNCLIGAFITIGITTTVIMILQGSITFARFFPL